MSELGDIVNQLREFLAELQNAPLPDMLPDGGAGDVAMYPEPVRQLIRQAQAENPTPQGQAMLERLAPTDARAAQEYQARRRIVETAEPPQRSMAAGDESTTEAEHGADAEQELDAKPPSELPEDPPSGETLEQAAARYRRELDTGRAQQPPQPNPKAISRYVQEVSAAIPSDAAPQDAFQPADYQPPQEAESVIPLAELDGPQPIPSFPMQQAEDVPLPQTPPLDQAAGGDAKVEPIRERVNQIIAVLQRWAGLPLPEPYTPTALAQNDSRIAQLEIEVQRLKMLLSMAGLEDEPWPKGASDGDHYGTYTSPYELLPTSGNILSTTAQTDTWDVTDQPEGKDGVTLKVDPRVCIDSGHLYLFYRVVTTDSRGNIVEISAETKVDAGEIGDSGSGAHNILDGGTVHSDSNSGSPSTNALIYGTGTKWDDLPGPGTGSDHRYKVLQLLSTDVIGWDWVRAHA